MNLKVQVDDDGAAYVAAIDPDTGEHRKAATVGKGQEVNIDLSGVSIDAVTIGEVVASGDGDPGGGTPEPPTTSAASEKPLYLVDGETQPVGFEAAGLETPDGKTLYHFAGDTAGQSATGNADAVSVYADADDNEKPVKPADSAEEVVTS